LGLLTTTKGSRTGTSFVTPPSETQSREVRKEERGENLLKERFWLVGGVGSLEFERFHGVWRLVDRRRENGMRVWKGKRGV